MSSDLRDLPRLLVIGARGFVGHFLTGRAANSYDVVCGDRTRESDETDVAIDVADEASVQTAFAETMPDAVVLLAAISDIDRCEREPELALAVNLRGAEHVANACARGGARLLFTSTGAVFDGRRHGYSEEDEVSPLSIYGETKAKAEAVVAERVPGALIVRVSLVLGRAGRAGTNSLLDTMLRRWKAGEVIRASDVESRNPIDAATLAEWMLELISGKDNHGIFHTGATDSMTRVALARAVAARVGVGEEMVQAELQVPEGRAPRGADHLLLTAKINQVCATQAPSCAEVIERSLHAVA